MNFVRVQPFRGLCNQLGAICWAIDISKVRKMDGVWIDGMVVDAEDFMAKRVPASTFLDLEMTSKALGMQIVERLPEGGKMSADLGKTKYDRGNLQHYIPFLVFAKPLREEASAFLKGNYSAVHLRIESDMLKHLQKVLKWKGNVYQTLLERYTKALEGLAKDQPLFVASNFGKTRKTYGKPIPATHGFASVIQTPPPTHHHMPNRDLRAVIDFLICVEANTFVGAPFSTFSQGVAHVRKNNNKFTLWI